MRREKSRERGHLDEFPQQGGTAHEDMQRRHPAELKLLQELPLGRRDELQITPPLAARHAQRRRGKIGRAHV